MQEVRKIVILGMSGGVDSSVSAYLLQQQGYDVRGVFMVNWSEGGTACEWEKDLFDARRIARMLHIPLEIWNFEKEYREKVFTQFVREYRNGRTPSPDVFCNKFIKFGVFYDRAVTHEKASYVATGHYARIGKSVSGRQYQLLSAIDPTKDQTYFLYQIQQRQLRKTLFPVGDMRKSEVKKIARERQFPNWNRPESMGICFIGEKAMGPFLDQYLPLKGGNIIDVQGKVLGEHTGLHHYTLGQRKGIGVGGGKPYFVVRKILRTNTLVVAPEPDASALLAVSSVQLTQVHWIALRPKQFRVLFRDRHLSPLQPARVVYTKGSWHVQFDAPKRAVTPGQSVVCYDPQGEVCLGGGVIKKSEFVATYNP